MRKSRKQKSKIGKKILMSTLSMTIMLCCFMKVMADFDSRQVIYLPEPISFVIIDNSMEAGEKVQTGDDTDMLLWIFMYVALLC